MAKDKNPLDDDYDGRPGGRGLSKEYAKHYDPQGEFEYTGLPDNRTQIEQAHAEIAAERAMEEMQELREAASNRVQFFAGFGPFAVPREDTFAGHAQLIDGMVHEDLGFNPGKYAYFDKIIAATANRPDIFDPANAQYEANAGIRRNLAVIRNYVAAMIKFGGDGTFDEGDERDLPAFVGMAQELGQAIANEKKPLPRTFNGFLDTKLLNMEGDGAAYAYRYLQKRQRKEGALAGIIEQIRGWLGMPVNEWNLPPVVYTPFSEDGLNALPPTDVLTMSEEQLRAYALSLQDPALMDLAKEEQARQEAPPVEENLDHTQRREIIEHGLTILRWFKDIKFSDKSVMELMDTGTPEEKNEMVGVVAKFVQYYTQITQRALQRDPNLANNEAIKKANQSAKVLQHSIELLAKLEKPVSISQTQMISTDVTQQPEHWNELKGETVDRLMQTLKGGLETAVTAFDQREQDQDHAQEQSQEAVLAATNAYSSYQGKGKKKKLQVSGKGGKQQQAIAAALRADDRAAGQGIYAPQQNIARARQQDQAQAQAQAQAQVQENVRNVQASRELAMRDLGMRDMEAVRSLGRTLAQSGNLSLNNPDESARGADDKKDGNKKEDKKASRKDKNVFGVSIADVDMNAKLKPDDKDVARTIIDKRRRDTQLGKNNSPKV